MDYYGGFEQENLRQLFHASGGNYKAWTSGFAPTIVGGDMDSVAVQLKLHKEDQHPDMHEGFDSLAEMDMHVSPSLAEMDMHVIGMLFKFIRSSPHEEVSDQSAVQLKLHKEDQHPDMHEGPGCMERWICT